VRAQVIWSTEPGVTVPVTAVTRINGQFFAFVAEPGSAGALVARQRAVTMGRLIGNDYVVQTGLKPGDKLITSGIQKIGDGSPVKGPASAPGGAPARQGR
jgi:multidrug efflux pump subunit AcrA (membrane-fusion protein)